MTSYEFTHQVPSEWVDYNGHMNDAEYNRAFSLATDAFIDFIGLDEAAREKYGYTMFTLETHTCYLKEMHEGDTFHITARVLNYDAKRVHLFLSMFNEEGKLVSTQEEMLMGIDQNEGRPAPFPASITQSIQTMYEQTKTEEQPKQVGRQIGL
ncbi:thioesterase family protein [Halobacillus salinus]|uniref:Thioesterase n=1 Tax=Halobacillus salinus TaxID=192814 RepID=A0A4Z0GX89_9BACI|nr:thioesterase family protein [Halobacillus salinus]TGB02410.1 thioesterase [Halobacillus salinus]